MGGGEGGVFFVLRGVVFSAPGEVDGYHNVFVLGVMGVETDGGLVVICQVGPGT